MTFLIAKSHDSGVELEVLNGNLMREEIRESAATKIGAAVPARTLRCPR